MDDVVKFFKTIAAQKKETMEMNQYLIYNTDHISLNGHEVTLTLSSAYQLNLFNELKPDMVSMLRTQLNHSQINVNAVIEEQSTQTKRVYTNQDKYDFLLEKFPALGELKKRLNLEIR